MRFAKQAPLIWSLFSSSLPRHHKTPQASKTLTFVSLFYSSSVSIIRSDETARNLFEQFPQLQEDFRKWNEAIKNYSTSSNQEEALRFFFSRQSRELVHPDPLAFAALLKSCSAIVNFDLGKIFHGYGLKLGYESNLPVSKALMNMYAKSGFLLDCHQIFDRMDRKSDQVLWNIVLSGHAGFKDLHGYYNVMNLFLEMRACDDDPKPNSITFAIVLSSCGRARDLDCGKSVHSCVIKTGLESETLVGNALISLYSKCGFVREDAVAAFDEIDEKDVVSWNAMISGFIENGVFDDSFQLLRMMLRRGGIKPNYATIVNILPICTSSEQGKEIHCYVLRRLELAANVQVNNSILSCYSRIGRLKVAELLFQRMSLRDIVSWNAMISGYAMAGESESALELFRELVSTVSLKTTVNSVTLVSILPVCAQLNNLQEGKKIHDYILRHMELRYDTAVGNALLSFYAKCGEIRTALWTFFMIPLKDLISWNTILDACAGSFRFVSEFVILLHQMLKEGIKPDSITILSILHIFRVASFDEKIKEAHAYSLRAGLLLSSIKPTLGNAIIDAYAKCRNIQYAFNTFKSFQGKRDLVTGDVMISGYNSFGCKEAAKMVFDEMPESDMTTWNLMIRAYAENDSPEQALALLHEMQCREMRPDMVSIMSVMPVCTYLASMQLVKQCHGYVVRYCLHDICLSGALLDVYSKCGSINSAYKLFQSSPQKDLVMFTAMVSAYAMHGMGDQALQVFSSMLDLGLKPDHVVITAALSACSHAGLVDEGWKLFESIEIVYGIKPTMEHYACVVDLLARSGRVRDAYSFVIGMHVEANANVWGTLLGACRNQHEVELGRVVADHLFEVEAKNIGNYVVMSNIYAADARWDQVREVRKLMRTRNITKPAGCSWIEVENKRHVFAAGDTSHPQRTILYGTLCRLDKLMKQPKIESLT